METFLRANIAVGTSPIHGYGVFAQQDISSGSIIEESPVMLLPKVDENHPLKDYVFNWGYHSALPLGYICLYNHAEQPNADFIADQELGFMRLTANRFIRSQEEIFIYYGPEYFSARRFEVKEPLDMTNVTPRKPLITRPRVMGLLLFSVFLVFGYTQFVS